MHHGSLNRRDLVASFRMGVNLAQIRPSAPKFAQVRACGTAIMPERR
jgi:hypothetical protein